MKKDKTKNPLKTFKKVLMAGALCCTLAFGSIGLVGCCADGENGKDGLNGSQWLNGTATPTNAQGVDGDYYIDTDDYLLYQKTNGQWVLIMSDFGKPATATNIELQVADGKIQWRYKTGNNTAWQDLIEVSTITGEDGREIELQVGTEYIQWRYTTGTDTAWKNLMLISALKGTDGATWLDGTADPTDEQGKNGDFYLNTTSYDIFKKTNDNWNNIGNIKGTDAQVPSIGANGNWFIGTSDTGVSAIPTDGKTPTIEINDDGYWVINQKVTQYKANVSFDEVYNALENVLEYDPNSFDYDTSFCAYDSGAYKYAQDNWHHDTSTFSGWGGSVGVPTDDFNALTFKVKAQESGSAISSIKVWLKEETNSGTVVVEDTLTVNIQPGESKEIVWAFGKTITNTENKNYYFMYACDVPCAHHGVIINKISENETQADMVYFTNGKTNNATVYTDKKFYIPVQLGMIEKVFVLSDVAINEVLQNYNAVAYKYADLALPSTIYGYKGQTLQLYFNNFSAYSIDDVYFDVSFGDGTSRGKQYSDRWEYTPASAETFNLTISVYNKSWELLKESSFSVVIKGSTTKNTVNVLVIGDSTVANGIEVSSMVDLDNSDDEFTINFLGTKASSTNSNAKHEGISGWTANFFVNEASRDAGTVLNPFWNSNTGKFDFANYMSENEYTDLDVVFIQLGINDMFGATTSNLSVALNNYITNINALIENIHSYDKNIKIVLNLIIPCQMDQNKFTEQYGAGQTSWACRRNTYMANLELLNKYSKTSNVYLSWYNGAIDAYNNITNDVHPNQDGYKQLGTQMYYYLKAIAS